MPSPISELRYPGTSTLEERIPLLVRRNCFYFPAHEAQPETETETWLHASAGALRLAEAIEHEREKLGRDAAAGVADAHFYLVGDAPQRNLNGAMGRGELDRVEQQIPQHLLHAIEVAEGDAR